MSKKDIENLLDFSSLIDEMTHIMRHTMLIDKSRFENDAEHSWHIAVMSLIFAPFAKQKVDPQHSSSLCVIHDLVEIYAGDTFAYDKEGIMTQKAREKSAAQKLFFGLPEDAAKKMQDLWQEFDECLSPEAKLANCMDRLQPFLHNIKTNGICWQKNSIKKTDVLSRMQIIKDFMPELWTWVEDNIQKATQKGLLLDA